jgi:hypothetical protein
VRFFWGAVRVSEGPVTTAGVIYICRLEHAVMGGDSVTSCKSFWGPPVALACSAR